MYETIYDLLILFIGVRGLWGVLAYILGRGAKYYNLPVLTKNKLDELPWYKRYFIWSGTLLWVGSKSNPSKIDRLYLLIGSVLQILVFCIEKL